MSLIGHSVLLLIASACQSVSDAIDSLRQRPIRLDEYSEVPQSSTAVEHFEGATTVLLPRVDCCCDRCPAVEKA
jgi:molybdopterin/thiamine biosynthesis adenylyltransferase